MAEIGNHRCVHVSSIDDLRTAIPSRGESSVITTMRDLSAWQFVPFLCNSAMGHGRCERLTIMTYNMSHDAVSCLEQLLRDDRIQIAQVIVSESLQRVGDGGAVYGYLDEVQKNTARRLRWAKAKSHAKTIAMRMSSGLCYTIIGSGNMASNTNHEAYVILTDPAAYSHVAEWAVAIAEHSEKGKR